jgi:hypothetical protein
MEDGVALDLDQELSRDFQQGVSRVQDRLGQGFGSGEPALGGELIG